VFLAVKVISTFSQTWYIIPSEGGEATETGTIYSDIKAINMTAVLKLNLNLFIIPF